MYGNGFQAWPVKAMPRRKGGPGRVAKYATLVKKIPAAGYLKVTGPHIKTLANTIIHSRDAYPGIQVNRRGNALYLSRKATQEAGT